MSFKSIDFILPDAHGIARGKQAPARYLKSYHTKGFGFPRSVLGVDVWGMDVADNGLLEEGDGDVITRAIADEAVPVTWAAERGQVQVMMYDRDGSPCMVDSRQVLIAAKEKFHQAHHLNPVIALELEFYLGLPAHDGSGRYERLPRSGSGIPMAEFDAYLMQDLIERNAIFDDIYAACEAQNIPVEGLVSENAPAQYEINFHHVDDIVLAADHAFLFKRVVKAIANQHGVIATFMAKPFADSAGNGMHVHMSLINDKRQNAFALDDQHRPNGCLSAALAGMINTLPDASLIFAPHFNSYKRLCLGNYAPLSGTWGVENRTTALRIPYSDGQDRRIEHRVAGADANPYLVCAALLGAVDYGLDNKLNAPAPKKGDGYLDDAAPQLARNWYAAFDNFANSDVMKSALGDKMHFMFGRIVNQEMQKLQERISDLEYDSYFRNL